MSKQRTGPQVTNALYLSTERKTPEIQPSDTFETPETVETPETNKGGRPRKDRPKVEKYTVFLTPGHWEYLKRYAADALLREGIETDRSDILRRLVDQLQAGTVRPW